MTRPRVLLADDHPLVVAGLKSLLEAECEVVGVVGDGRSLLEAASRCKPVIYPDDMKGSHNGRHPGNHACG
jgi:DNA-binding NarL/FixJ family response regulator